MQTIRQRYDSPSREPHRKSHSDFGGGQQAKTVQSKAGSDLHRLKFRAMGCQVSAWVATENGQAAKTHLTAMWAFIRAVETTCSRFRSESELCRLNALDGQPVRVSPMLWELLDVAIEAARTTDGLYNPAVLDALEAAGYDRSFEIVEDDEDPPAPIAPFRADWHGIHMDCRVGTVTLPVGMRLDLGGIAKGWTAERAADILAPLGPCLVDAGGDIAARIAPLDRGGWPIGVADPHDPESDLASLLVCNRGVATSGLDFRRWRRGGRVQHHLIDPRTGRPAYTDLWTVTVVAPDAVQADLHALVAAVLGSREGHRYLEDLVGVEGLLVTEDGRRMTTSGFCRYASGRGFRESGINTRAR